MKIDNKSTIEYLTLLSSDCANIEKLLTELTSIIFLPIKTVVVLAILVDQAGFISILAGLLILNRNVQYDALIQFLQHLKQHFLDYC